MWFGPGIVSITGKFGGYREPNLCEEFVLFAASKHQISNLSID